MLACSDGQVQVRNTRGAQINTATDQNKLATAQGTYFLATGIWSIVDIDSFQKVTGPKTDLWLVKTVGMLVSAIGASLLNAGTARRVEKDVEFLAVSSALGLTAIDVWYAVRKRISRIYLLDAVAELAIIAGWALAQPTEAAIQRSRDGHRSENAKTVGRVRR